MAPAQNWTVTLHGSGRVGRLEYREGADVLFVDWELGGTVVAIIMGPSADDWNRLYPWATGRQREILERIGSWVVAKKAPGCLVDYDPWNPETTYIRQPNSK
jgi:hypothetical protein